MPFELRIIVRGGLSGALAGLLAFAFARIFAEPLINRAIAYESGRDAVLDKLDKAARRPLVADGPEIFSRHTQSTLGLLTGLLMFSVAMGALLAVAYVVTHGRFTVRPSRLVWMFAAFGFAGVFLLPFVKYPANPPAIGHDFTVVTRGRLYLTMVGCSLLLLGLAALAAYRLAKRWGVLPAVLASALGFLILYGVLIGVLPSLGDLSANVHHTGQFGFARAATETPQPITNILARPLTIDGTTVLPGQLVYPGFDADLLWKFRWYSLIDQVIVWTAVALLLGALLDRMLLDRVPTTPARDDREPALVG